MTDTKIPHVSSELLTYLTRLYPDRCPSPSMSEREVWMAAGQAELIRKLQTLHKTQAERGLLGR